MSADIDLVKFWERVDRSFESPGGCWTWTGGKDQDGYGRMAIGHRRVPAHRVSYIVEHGSIPRGLHILHRCDTPACVNAAHLRTGTHQENMKERNERMRSASGAKNGRSKLAPRQVRAIRDLYSLGSYSYAELSEIFLIDPSIVGDIVNRKSWKDLA